MSPPIGLFCFHRGERSFFTQVVNRRASIAHSPVSRRKSNVDGPQSALVNHFTPLSLASLNLNFSFRHLSADRGCIDKARSERAKICLGLAPKIDRTVFCADVYSAVSAASRTNIVESKFSCGCIFRAPQVTMR